MSVHNDPGKDLCSMVAGLLETHGGLAEKTGFHPAYGIHPVHRLDRETSGIVMLATTEDAFKFISEQFEKHEVEKAYLAVLHGNFEDGKREGFWDWSLTKKPGGRKFPRGNGKRLACRTGFKVLDQSVHYAFVECRPLTGRTHQIRRHAKLAGHPVVGDPRYGSPRSLAFLREKAGLKRMGLHAMELTFTPPKVAGAETIRSEIFPEELSRFFESDK
jgi:23S rRNA-/tRNA-specific pseudouridylate synthase